MMNENAQAPIRKDANIPHAANALGIYLDLNHKEQNSVLRSPANTRPTPYPAPCALIEARANACNRSGSNTRKYSAPLNSRRASKSLSRVTTRIAVSISPQNAASKARFRLTGLRTE